MEGKILTPQFFIGGTSLFRVTSPKWIDRDDLLEHFVGLFEKNILTGGGGGGGG